MANRILVKYDKNNKDEDANSKESLDISPQKLLT